jgi:hypothetical protein
MFFFFFCGFVCVCLSRSFLTPPPQVRVWDLLTLSQERALPQPLGANVVSLAAGSGELWAAVGKEVVVWGRR